ncbi:hypothetical protein [Hankyongella ginsenosidimutans]
MREHQNTHNFQVLATDPIAESEIRALCEANGWALDKDESEAGRSSFCGSRVRGRVPARRTRPRITKGSKGLR